MDTTGSSGSTAVPQRAELDLVVHVDDPQPVERIVRSPDAAPPPAEHAPATGGMLDAWRTVRRRPLFLLGAGLLGAFVVMALAPGAFGAEDPLAAGACVQAEALAPPSPGHPFGQDLFGCDVYSQAIHGARLSLAIGLTAVAGWLVFGLTLGAVAGYFGGLRDTLISRIAEVFLAVPLVLAALVSSSLLRSNEFAGLKPLVDRVVGAGFFDLWIIIVVFGWPVMFRIVRASVLSVRDAEYVDVARVSGATDRRILVRHVLPNAVDAAMVYATLGVGVVIMAEAALTFLGVGVRVPNTSWGLSITNAVSRVRTDPVPLVVPAAFLSTLAFAFVAIGEALRDAFDPQSN